MFRSKIPPSIPTACRTAGRAADGTAPPGLSTGPGVVVVVAVVVAVAVEVEKTCVD
ncbi:MAG: hypothetical protein LBO05_05710 [Deltaproteobacteria bacterium]|jgi:hypothetical protein|nr:hypothetical protein [Deltaproteobacteria bacterium]